MDKDTRILSNLIKNLEDIKDKLSSIDFDRERINCILPKRESRSYINMKKVLESLVMKTVEGKGYDEDIASICNQHKPFLEKHLQFQNLFSSEEYLTEAKNLPNMPSKFEFLHSSLTTFQDFLGDILHSVCQISSCQQKLPSKILVKDLLKLKNQYLSIWDLISSVFGENKCHMGSDSSLVGGSKEIKSQVVEIQTCLQMSLKEMSRVKLEIEHYFKCNQIEMQFTKSPDDANSEESVNSKEEVESNTESEYSLLKMINSSSQDVTSNNMNTCSFSTRKELNNVALSSSSLLMTEAQSYHPESKGNYGHIYPNDGIYPPKTETWNEINNSFVETPSGDFFHKPISLPPNFFFVDPTTVLFQSKTDVRNRNSLPKIYSVDSLNENNIEEPTKGKSFSQKKNCNFDFNKEMNKGIKVEKVVEMPNTKNIAEEEDLFNENKSKSGDQTNSYSICLQEKISSMFGMLQSAEPSHAEEDIFEEIPLKIESNAFSYSEKLQNCNNLKFKTNKENCASNVSSLGKLEDTFEQIPLKIERSDFSYSQPIQNYSHIKFNTGKENIDSNVSSVRAGNHHSTDNTYKNKIPFSGKNHENICIIKSKVNYEIPFYFDGLKKHYNNDQSISQKEEVIYDKRSLIELYHSQEVDKGMNPTSTPGDHSTLSLWPVTAEYIQVSKSKRPQKCQSVSSDNSIPLSKSFGKSFYSLHLNKRYEQKQLYDGDLLVLDSPERSVRPESSSCSLLNQSYSIFNREENYEPHEKINNRQNVLGGPDNKQMLLLQEKNLSNLKIGKDLKSTRKNLKDVKKTLAVHYKDYEDSLNATGKNFSRKNFDFLKVNGFDVNNNWNSFISIFTSKVGQTAQINHHRMFSKVINTFTSDSLTCENVFGNVHTLTSNGGPFRLFDINGYPLTDSAGNVLKDPYGKSVVKLDSTGFPKDGIKVFDAAGNSPNDINFDPTQKPKTNSIVIKLTDNFKRALHLFDKYGRPLTDSCGKLLVNIHGRPLLRFDNFGRPNTDYRGGPLYTDNGYRWSYKTGDSLSSNESLIPKKLCEFLETESRQNSYENFCLKDKTGDESGGANENVELKTADCGKFPILNPSVSDIWNKVENILQQFPKSKKVDPKASQTSVIVNNVTITQNPIEKECLKSIIYHNNIIQQDVNHFNSIHSQPFTKHNNNLDFKNINNSLVDKGLTEKDRTYCVGQVLDTDGYTPYSTAPLPFPKRLFVQSTCSKCLNLEHPKHVPSNKFLNESNFPVKTFTCDIGDPLKNLIAPTTLTSYPKTYIKNKESYLALKNHDYLNNLCNRILKHEINYSGKTKQPINPGIFKNHNDWTDTSNTEFLSSIGSKYTTGFTTQTESPFYFSDESKNQSQSVETSNKYYNRYLKQQQHLDYYKTELDVLNKDRYCNEYHQIKNKKDIESVRQKSRYSSHEQTKEAFQNKSALSLPKPNDDKMSINILNKGNKHYEIKVTEMLGKMLNPKLNFGMFSTGKNSNEKSNSLYTSSKREIEISSKDKHDIKKPISQLLEENHNITEEQYKEKINNSLFRFSSGEIIESTSKSERNTKASYPRNAKYPLNSNVCKDSFKVHYHGETEYLTDQKNKTFTHNNIYEDENYYEGNSIKPLTQSEQCNKEMQSHKKDQENRNNNTNRKQTYHIKKPVSSNRECNLASFFGSPVKYVLNKLDGKRSVKPNKINRPGKKKTLSNSKENFKKSYDKTCLNNKIKQQSDTKIKTLYDITKSSKKGMLSSSERAEIRNHKDKLFVNEQDTLLAFRSKSCTELGFQEKDVLMSCSGDSQSVNRKKLSQTSIRRNTKYEQGNETPQIGPNSLNPNTSRRKYTKHSYSTQKSSKSRKCSSGRHSKSPLFSSRTKAKEINLFRKVEPEGKYMLKIKK